MLKNESLSPYSTPKVNKSPKSFVPISSFHDFKQKQALNRGIIRTGCTSCTSCTRSTRNTKAVQAVNAMAVGYDQVFEFAPQFGKYQLYVFIVAYLASCTIYGPMLTAGVYFQVLTDINS